LPKPSPQRDDIIDQARELAREVAPELDSILLTHCADAEALDTFRPGETDLATAQAVNREVAAEMAAAGVDVLVQRADKPAIRRWMRDRDGSAPQEPQGAWIDRGRLLRGAAAFEALGLKAPAAPPQPRRFGSAPGPSADRLLDAFGETEETEEGEDFDSLAEALLAAGRADVIDLAIRKLGTRHGEAAAEELHLALVSAAEAAAIGPSGWAELVTLPVALPQGRPPDAAAIGAGLLAAGVLEESREIRFLPGWRSPEGLAELSPLAVRRVLLDLLEGREPRDLPPGDTDELAEQGFGLLLGLQIDWDILTWEAVAAAGGLPETPGETAEQAEDARRATLFDRWRGSVFQEHDGCVPLDLVAPSEAGAEIDAFLEESGVEADGIEEIREAVATARGEAGEEEVVCRAEVLGDALELSFYTAGGRFLDSLTLEAERLPARAEEMPRLLAPFVRVVKDAPGH
jgi:hypothetical protein